MSFGTLKAGGRAVTLFQQEEIADDPITRRTACLHQCRTRRIVLGKSDALFFVVNWGAVLTNESETMCVCRAPQCFALST